MANEKKTVEEYLADGGISAFNADARGVRADYGGESQGDTEVNAMAFLRNLAIERGMPEEQADLAAELMREREVALVDGSAKRRENPRAAMRIMLMRYDRTRAIYVDD